MEPVVNPRAEAAALKAAQQKKPPSNGGTRANRNNNRSNKGKSLVERTSESKYFRLCCLCALCLDCIWMISKTLLSGCRDKCIPNGRGWCVKFYAATKHQSRLLLNGMKPYECRLHFTMINVLVLCSLIFMFGDMFSLAFVPASIDTAAHIVFLVVWIILVLELVFEVLIRPTGYQALTQSAKAYAPSTARFLNKFHLAFEVLALVLFIPELWCIFDSNYNCSEAVAMNMVQSSLKSVLGPHRLECFAGMCMFAFARLRIFGVVRHWKLMWINSSLTPNTSPTDSAFWSGFLVPPRCSESEGTLKESHMQIHEKQEGVALLNKEKADSKKSAANKMKNKKRGGDYDVSTTTTEHTNLDDDLDDDEGYDGNNKNTPKPPSKEEDLRLKNAATIGTALLVINSHRAMLLLVAIVALLPMLYTIAIDGGSNNSSYNMVKLLQHNNVLANSQQDCAYLENAADSWLRSTAFVQEDQVSAKPELSLVWAQLLPVRCAFQGTNGIITAQSCEAAESSSDVFDERLEEVCNVWGIAGSASASQETSASNIADYLQIREGSIVKHESFPKVIDEGEYIVSALFNASRTVQKM
jgi:hypothetical protein